MCCGFFFLSVSGSDESSMCVFDVANANREINIYSMEHTRDTSFLLIGAVLTLIGKSTNRIYVIEKKYLLFVYFYKVRN